MSKNFTLFIIRGIWSFKVFCEFTVVIPYQEKFALDFKIFPFTIPSKLKKRRNLTSIKGVCQGQENYWIPLDVVTAHIFVMLFEY